MSEFRPIPGFEVYSVSDSGQIARDGKLRTLQSNFKGYTGCDLSVGGQTKKMAAHRAVALAWIGPQPQGRPCVAHLDGDKTNNHVTNLKWVSYKENESHKRQHGTRLMGARHPVTKLTNDEVLAIRREWASGVSTRDLGKQYGVHATTIGQIVKGITWVHLPVTLRPNPTPDTTREALQALAVLEIPEHPQGNAGAYSIRHADIMKARIALAALAPVSVKSVHERDGE